MKPLIVRRSAFAASRIVSLSSCVQRTRTAVRFPVLSMDMEWDSTPGVGRAFAVTGYQLISKNRAVSMSVERGAATRDTGDHAADVGSLCRVHVRIHSTNTGGTSGNLWNTATFVPLRG